jgi:transglutaminase-like putative cysteine protease
MTKQLPWPIFAATSATLVATLLLHARWMPLGLLALLLGMIVLLLVWRQRGRRRLPLLLRMLLLAMLVVIVYRSLGNLFGREAGSALLAAMLTLKLTEADTRRDARVLVAVGAFLAMCGFLFDQGVVQWIFTALAVVLMLATLYDLVPSAREPTRAFGVLSGGAWRDAARLALFAIPFAVACFLFFPRLSSPLWGAPEDAFSGRTGMSDRMEPGALSALALDDTPVMRITFDDGVLPAPRDRYWRGLVLWWFDGRAWSGPGAYVGFQRDVELRPRSATIEYEVLLEPSDQRWMFMLDAPLEPPRGAAITNDWQVRWHRPITSVLHYRGRSVARYVMQSRLPDHDRRFATDVRGNHNPRARALAESWRARHGTDAHAIAEEALALFNREFSYSFEPPLPVGDPVDDFLFVSKVGFCEHFSSAFTFLMRAAGIPARVVVGYQGGYYNAAGGYLVVRREDAHAWSEIWLDGEGWVRVDPTAAVAPERVDRSATFSGAAALAGDGEGWLSSLRDRFDLIGFWWNRAVVQYSASRQRQLLQPFGIDDLGWRELVALLVTSGLLALAFAVWMLKRRRASDDPVLRAWHMLGRRLARAGIERRPSEGPRDYARRVASERPEYAAAVRALSERFVGLRYARPGSVDEARAFSRAVNAFRPRRMRRSRPRRAVERPR